jgi:hypothetical protein
MPDDVIDIMHVLARRQNVSIGLLFTDHNNLAIDDAEIDGDDYDNINIMSDDEDSEFVPDEYDEIDNDNYDDDDDIQNQNQTGIQDLIDHQDNMVGVQC